MVYLFESIPSVLDSYVSIFKGLTLSLLIAEPFLYLLSAVLVCCFLSAEELLDFILLSMIFTFLFIPNEKLILSFPQLYMSN